ncbi:hypothetical protein RRG08_051660 [Elysia crispata]|uniref:Uncharacterized protein n=1 Tax=Elysia crispata TaxID=231223 RepID=A0AAE1DRL2_9GAST|nr:hypothetical protein RRG08_051660 [Elysia crispata]
MIQVFPDLANSNNIQPKRKRLVESSSPGLCSVVWATEPGSTDALEVFMASAHQGVSPIPAWWRASVGELLGQFSK